MDSGIYIIENTVTGNVYIGQTTSLKNRFKSHIYLLRNNKHRNARLQASFNKHGEHCFTFKVIEITDILNEREVYWIDLYGGVDGRLNYNMSSGGNGGGKRSQEVCDRISKIQSGRKLSPTHCENISKANKGKVIHSIEARKAISERYKGRPLLEETKRKISETKRGVKLSEETKEKLKGRGSVPVIQYDLNGNEIGRFASAKEAGSKLNFWKSDITQCCLGNRKTVKGYIFKYENEYHNGTRSK